MPGDLTKSYAELRWVSGKDLHHDVLQMSKNAPQKLQKCERIADVQCHECKGFEHYKTECRTVRRRDIKCFGCKGTGHTQLECINDQKRRREKSLIRIDEADSEEDSENEDLNNFVAFIGITDFCGRRDKHRRRSF